jgi:hypothetical protein
MFDVDYFHKLVCDYGISVELLHDDDNSNEYGISVDWFVGIAELELGYVEKASDYSDYNTINPGKYANKTDYYNDPNVNPAKDSNDNWTKYGDAIAVNGNPWCASFVSWVAKKSGTPSVLIKPSAKARTIESQYKNLASGALYVAKFEKYRPRKGDLAFFWRGAYDNGSNGHVGIVVASTINKYYTLDGNSSDRVKYNEHDYDETQFLGFGINGGSSYGVIPLAYSNGKTSGMN